MLTIPVSTFHNQQIDLAVFLTELKGWIADDRFIKATDITGKCDANRPTVFQTMDEADRRPQYVPGVIKRACGCVADRYRISIGESIKIFQRDPGVGLAVKGFDFFQTHFVGQIGDHLRVEFVPPFFQYAAGAGQLLLLEACILRTALFPA